MSNETLTELRKLLAQSLASQKRCEGAYRALKAFKDSNQGLAFSATQLLDAAAALRVQADQLVAIAEDLHSTYSDLSQPEETLDTDISLDEQRRRNGVIV